MSDCPACAAANPDGFRFCGECGTTLAVSECPSCGAGNAEGQRFCGQCGRPLAGAPARATVPAVEERKLATVLFADIVGFTSLAERTDPEVVARMVDAAFRELAQVVAEHGGTVDKYMGDSMLAVFGVPVAHDDDAERAVAAGLAVRELGGDLAFSIGINSGEVMATAVGAAGDITVIGDTVNVAARLETVAAPGEVLCGRLTAELAGRGVVFRERRPVLLKGKREPVEVWEAVSLRSADEATTTDGPALVGRDDELAFLTAQWRRVRRDRQAHVVLLCGDAGSGKTRLVNELARVAALDGLVIRTTYPAYGAMGGPRVAAEILRQLGTVDDPDVSARVRSIAGELDPSLKAIDPAGIRQEQLWAFGRLLQEKGADRPLLMIIDDMHSSGDVTLEVLGELAGRLTNVALLTVLAGRTEPGDWLARFPAATTVRLAPLSRHDATALAGAFVCDKPLAAEAAEFFVDRANGNPLYLRELVATARARGSLVDDGDRYHLTGHDTIPATLQALLAARLDALEPGQKLGLQHVAVFGEAATVEQVASLGAPQADSVLRSLVDAGFLRDSDGRYDTVDSLLREVAYETLPHNVRGELHRRAAALATHAEERARHYDRAATYLVGDETVAAEAVDALAEAGEVLIQASRHVDAIRVLERAVVLGCRRPTVLLELAKAQALCHREDEALRTLAMVEDDPADPEVAIERDHTAANAEVFTDPASAFPRLEEAAQRWHAVGNTAKEAWARANAGVAYFYVSRMEEAARELERGLDLFQQIGDRAGAVATSSFLSLAKPTDRRVPQWLADALEYADAAGDRSRQRNVLTTLAWNHFFRSFCGRPEDMAEAESFAQRLADLAEELDASDMAVHAWSLLTIMARFSGRLDDATERGVALQRVVGAVHPNDAWLGWAASYVVAVAGGASDAAPPFPPDTSPDPVIGVAALVVEAELTVSGRVDEALARFEHAAHPDLGPIEDLTRIFYALALVLAGRLSDARPWVERAGDAARVLNAQPAVTAAAALWAEITRDTTGLPPPPTTARGVGDALMLRAYAAAGDASALDALRRATTTLAMPGLARGL